jgi:hypothetical protein
VTAARATPVRLAWTAPPGTVADAAQGLAQLGLASMPGVVSRVVGGRVEVELDWPENVSIGIPDTSVEVSIRPNGQKVSASPALVVRLPRVQALILATAGRPTSCDWGPTTALEWTLAKPVRIRLGSHTVEITAV